jgi:hypothetical protein
MKVGTRIMLAIASTLLLMALVSGFAIFRITEVRNTVDDLTNRLAKVKSSADTMVSEVYALRLYVNRYLRQQKPDDRNVYQEHLQIFKDIISEAEKTFTVPERRKMLEIIKTNLTSYEGDIAAIFDIIDARKSTINDELNPQFAVIEGNLAKIQDSLYQQGSIEGVYNLAQALEDYQAMHTNAFIYIQSGDATLVDEITERNDTASKHMIAVEPLLNNPQDRKWLQDVKTAQESYNASLASVVDGYRKQAELLGKVDVSGESIRKNATEISKAVEKDFN